MKHFRHFRINRTHVILIIIAAIVVVASVQAGGIGGILSYTCRRDAEAMGLNWMWSPMRGCLVQQLNGSWTPIERPVRYYGQ